MDKAFNDRVFSEISGLEIKQFFKTDEPINKFTNIFQIG